MVFKINEMFNSIQGEGRYAGIPVLFIRLSGCTRTCEFCDSKYHITGEEINNREFARIINKFKANTIVWTGGEPLLYMKEIYYLHNLYKDKISFHLETNGDLITEIDDKVRKRFDYICVSPKDLETAKKVYEHGNYDDIKVVTDLKMNKELIKYATMLMPLTTGDKDKDLKTQQNVWNYCIKYKIRYCPRVHVDVWGSKRGV